MSNSIWGEKEIRDQNSWWVELTSQEIERGWTKHGHGQEQDSRVNQRKNKDGANPTPEESLVWSCLSGVNEVSVRKAFGFPLDLRFGVGNVADIPEANISTRLISGEDYSLFLRSKDKPEWKTVGAVIAKYKNQYPTKDEIMQIKYFRLAGWYYVDDARLIAGEKPGYPEYYECSYWWEAPDISRDKLICIPQMLLRPMATLATILEQEGVKIDTSRAIKKNPYS